jgi:hypothetical protein
MGVPSPAAVVAAVVLGLMLNLARSACVPVHQTRSAGIEVDHITGEMSHWSESDLAALSAYLLAVINPGHRYRDEAKRSAS